MDKIIMAQVIEMTSEFVGSHKFRHFTTDPSSGLAKIAFINGKLMFCQPQGGFNTLDGFQPHRVTDVPTNVTDAKAEGWKHFGHGQRFTIWDADGNNSGALFSLFGTNKALLDSNWSL